MARAGVPERVIAVHVLLPGLDPTLDVAQVEQLTANRQALLDVDVDATERIDQACEGSHVDHHIRVNVQTGDPFDGLLGGLDARR